MIKPLGNNVLLKKIKEEEVTKSGIVVASNRPSLFKAIVMQVGEGRYLQSGDLIKIRVKPEDGVLYTGRVQAEIDEGLIIVDADQILGVL